MKIIKTKFSGLVLVKTKIHSDNRGFFKEVFKNKILKKKFIFDCMSKSKKNVLRGLHLQTKKQQGKFITVVKGKILDVAVDVRKKSKSFGKYFSITMSEDSDFSLYIPEGFAHGFLCLSKNCVVHYKCTNYRDKNSETTIKWNDKSINIKWPIKNPILSRKDSDGIDLRQFFKK
jgi:dTDP-4-dehydrorhamnose 3,5-epimerase